MRSKIKDASLAEEGSRKIEWTVDRMPVLKLLRKEFSENRPLRGRIISACLHITKETAHLVIALKEAGAEVYLCASNPLSTQDDIAACLAVMEDINVFGIYGEDRKSYYDNIKSCSEVHPHIILDDGGDLTAYLHREGSSGNIIGGTEETTTGVIRLRSMEREGVLLFPVIAVNDSMTKFLFDNRYGTGQSTIDGILRATNRLLAGSVFVVCGYGWCGKGVAMRAKGMGARVIVTEVDPIKAIEAVMDGFEVMPIREAMGIGDVFVTVTGNKNVITREALKNIKDGALLSNAGHFDVEIDKDALKEITQDITRIKDNVERYTLRDGRRVYLLSEGRLVNLSAAEGHPPEVMDLSFSNQLLAVRYIDENAGKLDKRVYRLPEEIDRKIAHLKLKSMGISIDFLTEEQKKYLSEWSEGT